MPVSDRRAALVEAAVTVMSREGMAGATTRAIVAEAGMQIGVFHYCFRSKDELVLEVMRALSDANVARVEEALSGVQEREELVRRALRAHWVDVQAAPERHLLTHELTQAALRQRGHAQVARRLYAASFTGMEALLAEMARTASFTWRSPVPVLARYVVAVLEGATVQWLVDRDDTAAQALLEEVAQHLLRASDPDGR